MKIANCWHCTRPIDQARDRTVRGLETGWHEYHFCSMLCLTSWAAEWYMVLARNAEKKRGRRKNYQEYQEVAKEGQSTPYGVPLCP